MITADDIINGERAIYLTAEYRHLLGMRGPITHDKQRLKMRSMGSVIHCDKCGIPMWIFGRLSAHDAPALFECPICGHQTKNYEKHL